MKKNDSDHGGYVRRVREDVQRYAHDLLGQNERLRVLSASLEGENLRLEEEVARAHEDLAHREREHRRLLVTFKAIQDETRSLAERYSQVESENSNLANLYVASYRLHGTIDRAEVLATIKEIIANLVGCEEMAIFERNPERSTFSLIDAAGIEPGACGTIPLAAGIIGRSILTGETYVATSGPLVGGIPEEADLTACIPLKLDGMVTGAIALYRLLPQKTRFEAVDQELFELLATHAATALYCSSLHARLATGTAACP